MLGAERWATFRVLARGSARPKWNRLKRFVLVSLGIVFKFDVHEAILGRALFLPKAVLFLIFYFVFSRLEGWSHKRFAHRHALEPNYSGRLRWSLSPSSGEQFCFPFYSGSSLIVCFSVPFRCLFGFSLTRNTIGRNGDVCAPLVSPWHSSGFSCFLVAVLE